MDTPTKDKPKKKGRPVEGWPGETKKEFAARLKREGTWSSYIKILRKVMVAQQTTAAGAHSMIWRDYPPPGFKKYTDPLGTHLETAVTPGGAGLYDFKTKRTGVSAKEVATWVFDHLAVTGVDPDDAPSPGAYALMMWVRANAGNRTQFYQNIWGKILAQKTDEGASAERFTDTGQSQLELIEQIENALLSPGPEGPEEEPSVPEEDDRVGVEQQGAGAHVMDDVQA